MFNATNLAIPLQWKGFVEIFLPLQFIFQIWGRNKVERKYRKGKLVLSSTLKNLMKEG